MEVATAKTKGSPVKLALIIIGAIVVGIWLLGILLGSDSEKTDTVAVTGQPVTVPATNAPAATQAAQNKNTVPAIVATTVPQPPPAAKSYQPIFTFKGDGAKKSEPFTVTGDRFKIAYDCTGSLCQAFLYKVAGNAPSSLIMNKTGSSKDETIIYGSGEYYIDANTIGTYTMTVSDYK